MGARIDPAGMMGVDADAGIVADPGGRGQTAERRRVRRGTDRTVEAAVPRRYGGRT
jgi:hypothetical protein